MIRTTAVSVVLMLGLIYIFKLLEPSFTQTEIEKLPRWIFIIVTIGMIFISLTVHELGHLITGLIHGFKFQLFVVGFLGVKRDENTDRVKVYFNTDFNYFGGVAATLPVDHQPGNIRKFANILIAGPLTSLFFAISCFVFSRFGPLSMQSIFSSGSLISFMIFLATTVPSKSGVFFSDRKRYQRLTSKGKDSEVEMSLLTIMGTQNRDQSMRNVNISDIETLHSDDTPFLKFVGSYYNVLFQMGKNSKQLMEAKLEFEKLSKKIPASLVTLFKKDIEKEESKWNE
ncbi:MAG: M50 family metallopeptidase [Bacteroidales bacterium]|nr:M50 family metallopeptidase [Bacteroidales bacterium]